METKAIWQSKTFWANIIAAIAMLAQSQFGYVISPEAQASALILINLVLRAITTSGVHLSSPDKDPWSQSGRARVPLLVAMQLGCMAALMGLVLLSGCVPATGGTDSRAETATKALQATQASIVGLAQAADDLCAAGNLDQARCQRVATLYGQSKTIYDLAADALRAAIQLDTPEAWSRQQVLDGQLTQLSHAIAALTTN